MSRGRSARRQSAPGSDMPRTSRRCSPWPRSRPARPSTEVDRLAGRTRLPQRPPPRGPSTWPAHAGQPPAISPATTRKSTADDAAHMPPCCEAPVGRVQQLGQSGFAVALAGVRQNPRRVRGQCAISLPGRQLQHRHVVFASLVAELGQRLRGMDPIGSRRIGEHVVNLVDPPACSRSLSAARANTRQMPIRYSGSLPCSSSSR